jgi:serine acetyltransferase
VTIGKDAIIGANIWLMEDVAPGTKVVQKKNI